ncbi:hypothetical protein BKA67DRAFT_653565 [Truncatella angustata]|uniref:Transmembrane protein 42 n=1 Tax=Truncatella angustata TaxID=152316 RepID=A0A9P8UY66_9PEZI|nr:uncharacterized protein BKA67DRAFT_653565 [Truncatella angustata]KAH6660382.1 hypothetical protein BKA67DRAFT_653565 [Truncatella angustata]KAH8201895.1 hypothetical protein TruAng_003982 [Truncatella angustata]
MPRTLEQEARPSPAGVPDSISFSTTTSATPVLGTTLRKRHTVLSSHTSQEKMSESGAIGEESATMASRNQWIVLAIASGACAAFNGVFAKLTTNDLTSHISRGVAKAFGLAAVENVIEVVVRASFFGLNLVFNGVMWTLFTKALARGNSTTQVSIMNTSTNFMITALLGLIIFSESLPPLWWLGAAMLVAGNVIIGRKDESSSSEDDDSISVAESTSSITAYQDVPQVAGIAPVEKDDEDEDIALLGDLD